MKRLLLLFTFLTLVTGQILAQENTAAACRDNADNDGDGRIDCNDPECTGIKQEPCEICNNGRDDDFDNFIDCYDKECILNSACDGFFLGTLDSCSVTPDEFPPFEMKLKYASEPNTANHINRLIVGDVDSDGTPEIVTTYRSADGKGNNTTASRINIFQADPSAGTTLPVEKTIDLFGKGQYVTFEDIAMADINRDGCAEYFVLTATSDGNGFRTVAYDCNGNEIWAAPIAFSFYPGTAGLADFDHDKKVELYFRTQIYDAHTGKLMGENNIDNDNTGINNGVNKGLGMNTSQTVAVDMDEALGITNGNLELIAGCRIYTVSINDAARTATLTLVKQRPEYATRTGRTTGSSTSIADFDQDGYLDVLAVGSLNAYDANTTIFYWNVKTDQLSTYSDQFVFNEPNNKTPITSDSILNTTYQFGWKNGAGRINIADIDGDNQMNAVYVSGKFLYALQIGGPTGLQRTWRQLVTEETSGYTGCTMFDFNADGKSEIVYRDEDYIYIFTSEIGGNVVKSPPVRCASRTSNEYPIVADMDGDGSTEICVTCAVNENILGRDHSLFDEAQVRIYQSANEPWVPARKVWNQHGYFVVNVTDSLRIPQYQQLHHLTYAKNVDCRGDNVFKDTKPLNSFLNQSPFLDNYGCPSFATPNLAWAPYDATDVISIEPITCPDRQVKMRIKFRNTGDIGISGNLPISVYDNDPLAPGANRLATFTIPLANMLPADTISIDTPLEFTGPGTAFTAYVVLNDAGTTVPTPISLPNTDIVECDYGDNVISVDINPGLANLEAANVQNNKKCTAAGTDNGAVKSWVLLTSGLKDSTNFDFYWSDGITAKPIASADHIGYLYNQLATDTYTVYGVHKTIGCRTDTAQAPVVDDIFAFVAVVKKDNDNDNCENPNGKLHVEMFLQSDVGQTNPLPPGNFTYSWTEGGQITTIGVNQTLASLPLGNYTVTVIHKATGCPAQDSETVGESFPPIVVTTSKVDLTCAPGSTGSASANVGGDTNNHTFYWYDGGNLKPTEDHKGASYSPLLAGDYLVVAEDKNTKCTGQAVVTIAQPTPPSFTTSKTDHVSCSATPGTGTASITVAGTPTIQWFTGQNTLPANLKGSGASISNLLPGIYTVRVEDANNCVTTDTVMILNKSGVTRLIPTPQHMTMCQPINGGVTVLPEAGLATEYTYTWYRGAVADATKIIAGETGNVLDERPAGFYTVVAVHNITGCQTSDTTAQVLNQTPTITINIDPTTVVYPKDCNDNQGSVSADITFSTPATFTVTWFGDPLSTVPPVDRAVNVKGPTTFTATTNATDQVNNVGPGYYTIDVASNDGCKATKVYFLRALNTDSLTYAVDDVTNCANGPILANGEIRVTFIAKNAGATENNYRFELWKDDGSTAPFQFIDGNAEFPDDNLFTFANLDTGHYFVRANDLSGTFCNFFSDVIEIKENIVQPTLGLSSNPNINCSGAATGSVNVALSTGPGPYSFEYFTGNVNTNIADRIAGPTVATSMAALASNFYTVKMTASNGCVAQKSVFVKEDTAMVLAEINAIPRLSCIDEDGQITVINVTEVRGTNPIPPSTPYNPAMYSITWYDSTALTMITDMVNPPENILEAVNKGSYYVEVVNDATQCRTSKIISTVDDGRVRPTVTLVTFQKPTKCLSEDFTPGDPAYDAVTGQKFGFLTVTAAPAGGNFTYAWTSSTPIATPNNPTILTLTPDDYTITVTNTDNDCPSYPETYTLQLDTIPINIAATSSPVTHCINPDGILNASVFPGVYVHYRFDWDSPTQDYPNQYLVTTAVAEHYLLTATDLRDGDCVATDTVTVHDETVIPNLLASQLNPVTVCSTDTLKQDGVAFASIDNDLTNYDYSWYWGRLTIPPNPTDTLPHGHGPMITNLRDITYTVVGRHIVTGCYDTAYVTITREPVNIPDPTPEVLADVTNCEPYGETNPANGAVAVYVADQEAPDGKNTTDYIFEWYIGESEKPTADFFSVHEIDSIPSSWYSVIATDKETECRSPLRKVFVDKKPLPPTFILEMMPTVCDLETGTIFLTMTNSIQVDTIEWSLDRAGDFDPDGVVVRNASAGVYTALVTGTNGCVAENSIELKVDINPFNGISRNRDGLNEYFHINCIEDFPFNVVKVYNRAGTLVYEGHNYNNNDVLFDGVSNKGISPLGTNLPDGTYFYVIDKHDGSKPIAGYLEIVN